MTQIVPDGEAIRIKMSEGLAEIEAHVYTLESTLKVSIKANGQFVAEIITVKAERDAALARVTVLQNSLEGLLSEVDALIGDSQGVYGLHLNGDNSPWDELGDWLPSRDTSRAAITAWNALKEQS